MQLLQPRMPNEYFIHVICLLILPTEIVWSLRQARRKHFNVGGGGEI